MHLCKTLLGSATPSLESYYLAHKGIYGYVKLEKRHGMAVLPNITFADLKLGKKNKTTPNPHGDYSEQLLASLEQSIAQKEQALLFQNRRGYSPYLCCESCGWVSMCNQCSVSLTYHQRDKRLKCHYCGHNEKVHATCPACGVARLKTKGLGTEKIEDELQELFPTARIARMDLDSTRKKNAYSQLLADIEDQKIDIVVGTQMVAKGLDFENVTLVGILNADAILNFPDFRAYERAFQLIEQVSGRSGRRSKKGKVIIQTFKVDHPILQFVHRHAYDEMVNYELFERNQFHYPPAYRMIEINIKHKDIGTTQRAAQELANSLKKTLEKRVLGPEFPLVSRIRNQYINTILIKFERNGIDAAKLKQLIVQKIDWIRGVKEFKSVTIVVDVDPM